MTDLLKAMQAIEKVIAQYDTWLDQNITTEDRFEFLNKKFGAVRALKAVQEIHGEQS